MTLNFEVKLFAILHNTSQSFARSLIALVKGYSGCLAYLLTLMCTMNQRYT